MIFPFINKNISSQPNAVRRGIFKYSLLGGVSMLTVSPMRSALSQGANDDYCDVRKELENNFDNLVDAFSKYEPDYNESNFQMVEGFLADSATARNSTIKKAYDRLSDQMNHGIEAQDLILNEMQNIADFIDDQGKEIFPDGGPSVIKRPSPPKSPIKKKEKAKDKILQMIVEILGEVFSLEDILSDLLDLFLEDKSIKKLIKKMKKTFSSAKSTSKKMKRLVRHLISLLKHLSSPAFIQQAAQSVGKKLLPRLATALAKRLVPFIGWASFFVDFSIAVAKNWVSIKKAFA